MESKIVQLTEAESSTVVTQELNGRGHRETAAKVGGFGSLKKGNVTYNKGIFRCFKVTSSKINTNKMVSKLANI